MGAVTSWFAFKYSYFSVLDIIIKLAIVVVLTYATYMAEWRCKEMVIKMEDINRMNDELRHLLVSLPEGIILINNNNKEVALANIEFNRLFGL